MPKTGDLRIRGIAVCAAITLLLSGCGGGGDGAASPAPQTGSPAGGSTNGAPTIQGQPGTSVLAGQSYSFQATASDPDGDALSFSATNLPAWASLNASSGRLTGTPTAADVGSYSGITISVSDGKTSASLSPFSIAVAAVAVGNATLSWVPPTENTDGSVLTNLGGYVINYGRDANNLSQSVRLSNPSISTYVVENLTSGAWFFAVVAVNANGVASAPSNVATKTIS